MVNLRSTCGILPGPQNAGDSLSLETCKRYLLRLGRRLVPVRRWDGRTLFAKDGGFFISEWVMRSGEMESGGTFLSTPGRSSPAISLSGERFHGNRIDF